MTKFKQKIKMYAETNMVDLQIKPRSELLHELEQEKDVIKQFYEWLQTETKNNINENNIYEIFKQGMLSRVIKKDDHYEVITDFEQSGYVDLKGYIELCNVNVSDEYKELVTKYTNATLNGFVNSKEVRELNPFFEAKINAEGALIVGYINSQGRLMLSSDILKWDDKTINNCINLLAQKENIKCIREKDKFLLYL